MSANQRLYQAEQTSATAVANAAQLQGEVLRLSNQMDELRLDLQTQSTLAETQQVCTVRQDTAINAITALHDSTKLPNYQSRALQSLPKSTEGRDVSTQMN